jgi:hypothetical protein
MKELSDGRMCRRKEGSIAGMIDLLSNRKMKLRARNMYLSVN